MVGVGISARLHLVRDGSWIPSKFENIRAEDFRCTSDRTHGYNCIAWAAGKTDSWWWPVDDPAAFWPLARLPIGEERVEHFTAAFATEGYEICEDDRFELGFEKIAIFVDGDIPTHAARLLPSGLWTSKLGQGEDIEHTTLRALEGSEYGEARVFLKRRIRAV
jgi:hypothetical protein